MQIAAEKNDGLLLLTFGGQLDAASADESEQALLALIDEQGLRVVVDLGPLTYLSSVGLGVILRLTKQVLRYDGRIVFHSLQPRVRQILDMTGLSLMLPLYDSAEEAIKGVSSLEPAPRERIERDDERPAE
jgi:stage II sporulation protein AA (anti-sigma F factor antagonist)